jgi:hypothetical protein
MPNPMQTIEFELIWSDRGENEKGMNGRQGKGRGGTIQFNCPSAGKKNDKVGKLKTTTLPPPISIEFKSVDKKKANNLI